MTEVNMTTDEREEFLQNYLNNLDLFVDFPCDSNITNEIVALTKANLQEARYIADLIMAKIINPAENHTIKLSIFALISRLIKVVERPYAFLFEHQLNENYEAALCRMDSFTFNRIKDRIGEWRASRALFNERVVDHLLSYMDRHKDTIVSMPDQAFKFIPPYSYAKSTNCNPFCSRDWQPDNTSSSTKFEWKPAVWVPLSQQQSNAATKPHATDSNFYDRTSTDTIWSNFYNKSNFWDKGCYV
jgi:hypothetical protein